MFTLTGAGEPDRYILLQQFQNPANPEIHFKTTGPEIWDDTEGGIDVLVSGVGTGGTITGVSRFIKKVKGKPITSVAVEPVSSAVITQTMRHEGLKPGPHKIQGIGAGFIPDTLDLSMVDRVELVTNEESIDMARRLARDVESLSDASRARPTTSKPVTAPPLKATRSAAVRDLKAACVVRTFVITAMRIPIKPAESEQNAPITKPTAVA